MESTDAGRVPSSGAPGRAPGQRATSPLGRLASACALLAMAAGAVAVAGWLLGIRELTSIPIDRNTLKMNGAVALMLTGVALHLHLPDRRPRAPGAGRACAVVVGAIGGLTLLEHRTGWDLGIDELLVEGDAPTGTGAPGRMAEASALGYLLLGIALVGLEASGGRFRRAGRWLTVLVLGIAYLAVLGYTYGASELYSWSAPTQMSLETSLGLLVVAAGVLAARPGDDARAMLASPGPDGVLLRRTLPAAFLLLTVLGGLMASAVRSGAFDHPFATSLGVAGSVVSVCGLVVLTAAQLRRAEDRRVAAQAETDASHLRVQAIVDQLPAGVHVKDLEGRYQLVNRRLERFLHQPRGSMLGLTARDLYPPPVADAVEALDRRTLAATTPIEVEESAEVDGVERTFLSLRFPLLDAGGEAVAVCGISTDITERVQDQRERALFEARRATSERFEALGQLAGGVAHDFNNLLTIILSYAAFLAPVVDGDDQATEDLRQIEHAARKGAGLTSALLAFSRRETIQPVPVDLNQLVGEARDLLERSLGGDVAISVTAEPALWPVTADPGALSQVLVNLAVNARHAMPDGGRVTIETANVDVDGPVLGLDDLPRGRYVRVTVADTGTGMTADVQARAFDPFFTTREKGAGTGLGLASALGTVTQAGGHIRLYSEVGVGTAVKIYLPATTGDGQAVTPAGPDHHAAAAPPAGARVLLVEDEPVLRDVAVRVLAGAGLEVHAAADGADALRVLADGMPVDLLVTDVIMPGMTGPELVERVEQERPDLSVLYMSGYPEGVLTHGGVVDPGVRLLEKPFSEQELLDAVGRALAERP